MKMNFFEGFLTAVRSPPRCFCVSINRHVAAKWRHLKGIVFLRRRAHTNVCLESVTRHGRNNAFLAVTVTVRQEDVAVSGCLYFHFEGGILRG